MDIITNLPKSFTTGEIDKAFMNEIKSGFKLEKETEHLRVAQAQKEFKSQSTHTRISRCEFFYIRRGS